MTLRASRSDPAGSGACGADSASSGGTVQLGWDMGYWGSLPHPFLMDGAREAERLGLHSIWAAESYGSDCFTPLSWVGAHTTRPRLGTAITQMSARTPTAVAMAAMTMDHLSDGRFVLGL